MQITWHADRVAGGGREAAGLHSALIHRSIGGRWMPFGSRSSLFATIMTGFSGPTICTARCACTIDEVGMGMGAASRAVRGGLSRLGVAR